MPTEYVIQKKSLTVWQYVTWYSDREQAEENFAKIKPGNGYSYRLVELNVLAECINEPDGVEKRPVMEPEHDDKIHMQNGSSIKLTPSDDVIKSSSWGSFSAAPDIAKSEHGMTGKVWLGNPATKEKRRVEPSMVDSMMANGWVRSGPRSAL